MQDAVEVLEGHKYFPTVINSDVASAITVAIKRVFGPNYMRGMCCIYTIINVDKKIDKIRDEEIEIDLREGLKLLQIVSSEKLVPNGTWFLVCPGVIDERILQLRD